MQAIIIYLSMAIFWLFLGGTIVASWVMWLIKH